MKRRYQGVCRGCGAPTTARGGKGDAYEFCKDCHPGAIAPTRTRDWVREAMHEWRQRYGRPPSSTDWSPTHARRRGGEALDAIPSSRLAGAVDRHRHLRVLACSSRRRVPRRLTGSVCRGPSAQAPGTYQTRCPASFRSATTQPTATRRVDDWHELPSRTPRSCSSASAPSAPTFKACAS